MAEPDTVKVAELPIRLGQLLKLLEVVQDGFEAKIRIQYGEVLVNGETETRRGRKITHGDVVSYGDSHFRIVSDT